MRHPPPPPSLFRVPSDWKDRPAPWESAVVAEHYDRCCKMARKVWGFQALGWEHEDVVQEMVTGLIAGLRNYYWNHNHIERPASAFVWTVLHRKKLHVIRAIRARQRLETEMPTREGDDGEQVPIEIASGAMGADESMSEEELDEMCEAMVYALGRNLPPAMFALLHLRYIEELSPSEIASLTRVQGANPPSMVSGRLQTAKSMARDYLRQLGIVGLDQAAELRPEDYDESDLS